MAKRKKDGPSWAEEGRAGHYGMPRYSTQQPLYKMQKHALRKAAHVVMQYRGNQFIGARGKRQKQ